MALTIRLTRISPTDHRFEYERADGTGEQLVLVTREFLRHDLVHFAVETEARLRGSFYGLLDRIGGYAEISLQGAQALRPEDLGPASAQVVEDRG